MREIGLAEKVYCYNSVQRSCVNIKTLREEDSHQTRREVLVLARLTLVLTGLVGLVGPIRPHRAALALRTSRGDLVWVEDSNLCLDLIARIGDGRDLLADVAVMPTP